VKIVGLKSKVVGTAHFVQIEASNGLVGFGQSACWAYPNAVHEVIETFRDHLIGADPRRIEHHWQYLYRMGPFRGAVLTAAVSAIDIALWDLKGKSLDVPIYELLGGAVRDRIRLHMLLPGNGTDQLVVQAKAAVADGFTAIKLDPLPQNYYDLGLAELVGQTAETAHSIREAVGTDVDIIYELHRKLTPLQAPSVISEIQQTLPLMIEDPIQIDSIMSQAQIVHHSNAPIGNGERLHTVWEFKELLAQGGAQYIRPDLGLAGGITHVKKIAAIAESFHSAVITHNCLGPLLTMAAVHLDASIPNFVVQEYSPLDDELSGSGVNSSIKREGGWMPLPTTPGHGVILDWDLLEPHDLVGRPITRIPIRKDGSVAYSV
jgi:galactonate dehydratase